MLKRIKRSASLMATTIGTGVVANMSMGEGYLSIIFGGQIFKDSFEEDRLEKHMLSRCLEEGATLSTSLIPWTTSGAFITGVLGMSPLEFSPWAFLTISTRCCLLGSLIWALEYSGNRGLKFLGERHFLP